MILNKSMICGTSVRLVSVNVCALPIVPTFWLGNVRLVGVKLKAGVAPVPTNATCSELMEEPFPIESAPIAAPVCWGSNSAETSQLCPTGREVGQSFNWLKGALVAIDDRSSGVVPRFVIWISGGQ